MRKILQLFLVALSALLLTACFDLMAQSKYIEVEQSSRENKVILGPTGTGGDVVIYTIVKRPEHGELDESKLPEVSYTPDADFSGQDAFTFKLGDGTDESNVATIAITVIDMSSGEPDENSSTEAY